MINPNAPETNSNLVKKSKKQIKGLNRPIEKYECKVYFGEDKKVQFTIRAASLERMDLNQKLWSHHYSNNIIKFSEVKQLKVK